MTTLDQAKAYVAESNPNASVVIDASGDAVFHDHTYSSDQAAIIFEYDSCFEILYRTELTAEGGLIQVKDI